MAHFAFNDMTGKEFIFELNDETKIEQARKIVSGAETYDVHVMGRIIKRKMPYNPDWDFHFDPATIGFFSNAIEICDAVIPEVQERLDEACGAFLPGCIWCPWTSKVVREVTV